MSLASTGVVALLLLGTIVPQALGALVLSYRFNQVSENTDDVRVAPIAGKPSTWSHAWLLVIRRPACATLVLAAIRPSSIVCKRPPLILAIHPPPLRQSAGSTTVSDLSGNGLNANLPNGGTFNGQYVYLTSTGPQYVNISSALKPYLNTQSYTVMACLSPQSTPNWARLWDFVRACIVWHLLK